MRFNASLASGYYVEQHSFNQNVLCYSFFPLFPLWIQKTLHILKDKFKCYCLTIAFYHLTLTHETELLPQLCSLVLYTCLYLSHRIGPPFLPGSFFFYIQLYSINCILPGKLCLLASRPLHLLLSLLKVLYLTSFPWTTNALRCQLICLLFQEAFPYTLRHPNMGHFLSTPIVSYSYTSSFSILYVCLQPVYPYVL